ncbi:MAG TPA: RNA polymerase sigma factor RpoD/SigA [Longimicrobiaceae bacterium]|nr:RNA polymerase sigma factor RpoD/SigA [Longimicrobiaceae bacterium]
MRDLLNTDSPLARGERLSLSAFAQYTRALSALTPLNEERERELARAARAGDASAREALVCASLRYVVVTALRYRGRGLDLEDLVQEGNAGVVAAVDRFDPERGVRFTHYAYWWIRRGIYLALQEQVGTVRLPSDRRDEVTSISRTRARLRQFLQREPTVPEVAEALGTTADAVHLTDSWARVEVAAPTAAPHPEMTTPGPAELLDRIELRERVERVLARLSPRQAQVLRLYYGLDDGRDHTLEEIGELLGVSKQSVQVAHKRALANARKSARPEPPELIRRPSRRPRGEADGEVVTRLRALDRVATDRLLREALEPQEREIVSLCYALGGVRRRIGLRQIAAHLGMGRQKATAMRDAALAKIERALQERRDAAEEAA